MKVISGFFPDENKSFFTVYDYAFDWSKYRLKTLVVTAKKDAGNLLGNDSGYVMCFVYDDYGDTKFGVRQYGTPRFYSTTVDTTENMKLSVGVYGEPGNLRSAFYIAILEAKT